MKRKDEADKKKSPKKGKYLNEPIPEPNENESDDEDEKTEEIDL